MERTNSKLQHSSLLLHGHKEFLPFQVQTVELWDLPLISSLQTSTQLLESTCYENCAVDQENAFAGRACLGVMYRDCILALPAIQQ